MFHLPTTSAKRKMLPRIRDGDQLKAFHSIVLPQTPAMTPLRFLCITKASFQTPNTENASIYEDNNV